MRSSLSFSIGQDNTLFVNSSTIQYNTIRRYTYLPIVPRTCHDTHLSLLCSLPVLRHRRPSTSRLVRHSPALLLYHEDTLAPRIEFIKQLFPETPKLLSRAPLLVTHDPETFLLPKIKQLESLLPGVDVLKVVRWGGSLVMSSNIKHQA